MSLKLQTEYPIKPQKAKACTGGKSLLLHKLILRDALPHRTRRAHTATNHLQQLIGVIRARPLLVRDNLHALVHLRLLNHLAISPHTALREVASERVGNQRGAVQARQRDELPAVAHARQALDVGFLLRRLHRRLPVEGGREVVRESEGVRC